MSIVVIVGLLLCGFGATLSKVTSGKVIVGVIEFPELLFYARETLASCPVKDNINITAISMDTAEEASVLEQADKLKVSITEDYFAVVGPLHEAAMLVAEDRHIPYLATETDFHGNAKTVYHVLPSYTDVIECIRAIVNAYKWKSLVMLWENNSDDTVLAEFMESLQVDVKMYRIRHVNNAEIRNILHNIREFGIRKVVLLTSQETTEEILSVARRLGVLSVPYSYIILNRGEIDLENIFSDLQTNVTIICLTSNQTKGYLTSFPPERLSPIHVQAVVDSMLLICDVTAASDPRHLDDLTLEYAIQKARDSGSEMRILFGEDRRRTGFTWDIYSYSNYRLTKIAEWIKGNQATVPNQLRLVHPEGISLRPQWPRKKAKVVTILEKPWIMRKDPLSNCTGNSCYDGFVVDMMAEIAKQPIFQPSIDYELYIVPDGLFGSLDPLTMEWNGIMGEIISGNATLSLAPLSINKQREEAVDFTKPFKTRGITMLIKTPESSPSFFQFLAPLSYQVWGMILLAMVVMSFALSLYEKWGTRQRRDMLPIIGQESCWFAFGTLMQEGTEVSPVTVAGRILTAAWWFFAMILISSYTANLAAFLTVKKINSPIESISDLVGQTKIKYGTVRDSGVLAFFSSTQIEPYRTMARRMGPDSLVNNTSEGLARVLQGSYAFLWDNTVNSYIAATDCRFTEIGEPFDHKGFGIGVPSGATYRENLTLAVLALADNGILDQLMDKWWKADKCQTHEETTHYADDTEELKLENVAGIFFILAAGLILGLIACLIDKYTSLFKGKKKADCGAVEGTKMTITQDRRTNSVHI